MRVLLARQTGRTDAVAAAATARAAQLGDRGAFCEVDRRLTATKLPREAREASLHVGRQMLATAASCESAPHLQAVTIAVSRGEADGNYASVAGTIVGLHGSAPAAAAVLVIWGTISSLVSAAVRLGGITHVDAQRVITHLRPLAADLARKAATLDARRVAGSTPFVEIWSMRHEVAATRLFAS